MRHLFRTLRVGVAAAALIGAMAAALVPVGTAAQTGGDVLPARDIVVTAGRCELTLETATTPEQSRRGLMFRESMPADRGMAFLIPENVQPVFWMKNTVIPLDIAFLSADWEVMAIEQMAPLDLSRVYGPLGARFAIEVNLNRYEECGVAVGDRLERSD